jgi:hypothetical protein
MSLAIAAIGGTGDDSIEEVRWQDMTPSQRAVARAAIGKRLAELATRADSQEDEASSPPA